MRRWSGPRRVVASSSAHADHNHTDATLLASRCEALLSGQRALSDGQRALSEGQRSLEERMGRIESLLMRALPSLEVRGGAALVAPQAELES